jgi:hypothetical protein
VDFVFSEHSEWVTPPARPAAGAESHTSVDAPFVAGAVVVVAEDAVERRVAHEDVWRRHVDLRAQHPRAVRELALLHPAEEVQIFLHGTIAVGAVHAGLCERAAILPHLLGGLVIHVGDAFFDQAARDLVELAKEVGREVDASHLWPSHLMSFSCFRRTPRLPWWGWCRQTEVAGAAILPGDAKINAQRLRVPMCRKPLGSAETGFLRDRSGLRPDPDR